MCFLHLYWSLHVIVTFFYSCRSTLYSIYVTVCLLASILLALMVKTGIFVGLGCLLMSLLL